MPFGQTDRKLDYPKPAADALVDAREALDWVGDVKGSDERQLIVEGVAWYGSQKVKMQITVRAQQTGSQLEIVARGDDLWAFAAKRCLEKFLEALANIDNPDYIPNQKKPTESPPGIVAAFGVLALFGAAILVKAWGNPWGTNHTAGVVLLAVGLAGLVAGLIWWKFKQPNKGGPGA